MTMRHFARFVLLLLLIAALLRVDFFFTVIYFLVAILVLSRLWVGRAAGRLRVERRFVERAFTGDQVEVELRVPNGGWLPLPWLELSDSVPLPLQAAPFGRRVLSLGPHEEERIRYRLTCRRRGYYTLGPATARTGDLFGIARRALTWHTARPLIVYPRVVPLRRLELPTRTPLVALPARVPLFEDPSRVMGVRDYRRGDSPRRMHWPATARTGRLVVKQYQPAIARETLICLDLDRGSYAGERRHDAPELAIVAAASFANHVVVREGLPVGLLTSAWDPLAGARADFTLPPRVGRAQLIGLLEILARVEVAPATEAAGADGAEGADFVERVRRARADLSWGTTVVVITGRESDGLHETLLGLRRGGFAPTLLLVQPDGSRGIGDPPGVPVQRIWRVEDLEGA